MAAPGVGLARVGSDRQSPDAAPGPTVQFLSRGGHAGRPPGPLSRREREGPDRAAVGRVRGYGARRELVTVTSSTSARDRHTKASTERHILIAAFGGRFSSEHAARPDQPDHRRRHRPAARSVTWTIPTSRLSEVRSPPLVSRSTTLRHTWRRQEVWGRSAIGVEEHPGALDLTQ